MLTALDNMALSFADAFNAVHEKGRPIQANRVRHF